MCDSSRPSSTALVLVVDRVAETNGRPLGASGCMPIQPWLSDAVTLENGPLKVIPASHHSSSNEGDGVSAAETIQARAGEILAMRPLLTHSSGSSQPGTKLHRRILHLEFSDREDLPDSYQWHDFVALSH